MTLPSSIETPIKAWRNAAVAAQKRTDDAVIAGLRTQVAALEAQIAADVDPDAPVAPVDPVEPDPTPAPEPSSDAFVAAAKRVSGLKHLYLLDSTSKGNDLIGSADAAVKGSGVSFTDKGAVFTGKGYLELPDADDFSVVTYGGLSIVLSLTIDNWKGSGASEYVHWMGKGVNGAHEWTFRHYVDGGSGEASSRQGRVSFYHFNPSGGLGAGSYFQDAESTTEHVVTSTVDMKQIQMFKDGLFRDSDDLSGYSIVPKNTGTPVRIGTRDMSTGFLIGKVRRVAFYNRVLTAAEIKSLASFTSA